jgi:malonate decarboxylase delta subunit
MTDPTSMESLHFVFDGVHPRAHFVPILVGVVGSGNLEVLLEPLAGSGRCQIDIRTSARGFGAIWEAVARDFHDRHSLAGVAISINDMGATPAVVSLRLDQAAASLPAAPAGPTGAQP